ncbi:hypothetical protein N8966_04750 [Candidatus Pelagibacter ubique]|nr:hypothetical protein [Candidatus Pelagibacter ubique]
MKKLLLTIIIIFGFSNATYAAEEGQFRFGAEIGWSPVELEAEDTAQSIANALGETVTTTYDTGVFVGRLFGEYGLSSNTAIEAGYFRTSSADAKYSAASGTASESYDVYGFDAALVLKSSEGIFGKVGMHSSTVDGAANVTIGGTSYAATGSADGSGLLFGAGYEVDNTRYAITRYNDVGGIDTDVTFLSVGFLF